MIGLQFRREPRQRINAIAIVSWALLFLGAGAVARADSDVGTLIITLNRPSMNGVITARDPYRSYIISAKRADGKDDVDLHYVDGWARQTPNDLGSSGGIGAVVLKELSAGDWVVDTYEVEMQYYPTTRWHPTRKFAIPFKIQAGRATYVGSFQPVAHMTTTLFGTPIVGGASLLITDRSNRDVPIARAKQPSLGPVDVNVYDVDSLNNPLLSSH